MRKLFYFLSLVAFSGSVYLGTIAFCQFVDHSGWRVEVRRSPDASYTRCVHHERRAGERLAEIMVKDQSTSARLKKSPISYLAGLPRTESARRRVEPYMSEIKAALEAADEVDIIEMNMHSPGLGNSFANNFREGLRSIYFGVRDRNNGQVQRGIEGVAKWKRHLASLEARPEVRPDVRADMEARAVKAVAAGIKEIAPARWAAQ